MPRIKGWKKGKSTSRQQYYVNTNARDKRGGRIHMSIGNNGDEWVVFIVKKDRRAIQPTFATKKEAYEYAINYMKRHPNG